MSLLIAVVLTGTACSSDDAPPAEAAPTATVSAHPSPSPSARPRSRHFRSPLLGTLTQRPAYDSALAVVVDVRRNGVRAVGLDGADFLYVVYAEPGLRRVLAVYSSQLPREVGPVGGTRPADRQLVRVLKPIVVFSGGTKRFVLQINRSGLPVVNALATPSMFRRPGGGPPYVLAQEVLRSQPASGTPPPLLSYAGDGEPLAPKGVRAARRLEVTVPGHEPAEWRLDGSRGVWRSVGELPAASSIIVQRVGYRDVLPTPRSTRSLPDAEIIGSGQIVAVSGPQSVSGTWRKPRPQLLTNYTDADHNPLRFVPGRAVVLLVPTTAIVRVS